MCMVLIKSRLLRKINNRINIKVKENGQNSESGRRIKWKWSWYRLQPGKSPTVVVVSRIALWRRQIEILSRVCFSGCQRPIRWLLVSVDGWSLKGAKPRWRWVVIPADVHWVLAAVSRRLWFRAAAFWTFSGGVEEGILLAGIGGFDSGHRKLNRGGSDCREWWLALRSSLGICTRPVSSGPLIFVYLFCFVAFPTIIVEISRLFVWSPKNGANCWYLNLNQQ